LSNTDKGAVGLIPALELASLTKEVQKFLGLANYYRRFIKDFAKIAAPLHELVRKEQKWK